MTIENAQLVMDLSELPLPSFSMNKILIAHPIPYQGSKRRIANLILKLVENVEIDVFYEPFCGSAATTLAAAAKNIASSYYINDSLVPLGKLWELILNAPESLATSYGEIWLGHVNRSHEHYYEMREQFNADQDPAKLLYLLARCVKNAVRFNSRGEFNQSTDQRRLGTRPEKMRREIFGANKILSGITKVNTIDYRELLKEARPGDFVYLDPPWQGTSTKKDNRYFQQLDLVGLIASLKDLNERRVPFLLSFDGRLGSKQYGVTLPVDLNLTRLEINAGRSSQATLSGNDAVTFESLYISPMATECLNKGGNYDFSSNGFLIPK